MQMAARESQERSGKFSKSLLQAEGRLDDIDVLMLESEGLLCLGG